MGVSNIIVKGLKPDLTILGSSQRFLFDQNNSIFSLYNSFIPLSNVPSNTNHEFRNQLHGGFRFVHSSPLNDNLGTFALKKYINDDPIGTDVMLFANNKLSFLTEVELTIPPFFDDPTDPRHAANKRYVDNHNWTVSDITDFNSSVLGFRLDQFALPNSSINLNNNKLINLAEPTASSDATTKNYVDSAIGGLSNSIELVGDISASGTLGSPINTTFNRTLDQIANNDNLNIGGFKLNNVANPVHASDAVNLLYMQNYVSSHSGTITSITAGTGLSGGVITTNGTIALADVGISSGSYTWPTSLNINAQGQVIGASSGAQPVTDLLAGTGISINQSAGQGQISLVNNGVTQGWYSLPTLYVDNTGRISSISSGSIPAIDINSGTTGNLLASRIAGFPSNSSLFLNGMGNWSEPIFPHIFNSSNSTFDFTLNNTNSSSIETRYVVQQGGNIKAGFGYLNSTNQVLLYGYGTADIIFGTANSKKMQLLNNGTLDLLSNDLITSGNINAKTGVLKGNNLASYNSSAISVLNQLSMNNIGIIQLGSPNSDYDATNKIYVDNKIDNKIFDINSNSSGQLNINRLQNYPANSSVYLRGDGNWTTPSASVALPLNLYSSASTDGRISIYNSNSSAVSSGFEVYDTSNGYAVEFGFNNSTNEGYVWTYGSSTSIKFGINNIKRMELLNNGSLDLLTNDLNTSGNISAKTGTLKANNLASYNSSYIAVLNGLSLNYNRITSLGYPSSSNDAATKSYVDNEIASIPSGGGGSGSIMHGYVSSGYTSNISSGDHIKFSATKFTRGSNISLYTSSYYTRSLGVSCQGRITLSSGRTYKLTGSINNVQSNSYNATSWYNADTGATLGLKSGSSPPTSSTDRVPSAVTVAYITTTSTTRVELRLTWNSFTKVKGTEDAIGPAWFTVEEV